MIANAMVRMIVAAHLALLAGAVYADGAADRGKELYRIYCTQCHGVLGNGKGVNAATLSVQPRDHTDTAEMSARTDEDLFKAIKHGGKAVNKSVLMPNWNANLGDDDIHLIVAYLRELCCKNN
ncbi:MAG TPA: cytochrome c [Steroidobacter sp.]|uniref:c-type cytochrome n=1 Tax=Steroidobacter sp. TaxID=1978227 RepID=UPI002ED880C6